MFYLPVPAVAGSQKHADHVASAANSFLSTLDLDATTRSLPLLDPPGLGDYEPEGLGDDLFLQIFGASPTENGQVLIVGDPALIGQGNGAASVSGTCK
jgi:hypothetical protein